MGHYRVTIVALGGHGCQRDQGDGEGVVGCERHGCPDCITREYVRRLKRVGGSVEAARIEHWPADLGYPAGQGVEDDLLTGIRRGNFPEREEKLRAIERRVEVRRVDGETHAITVQQPGGSNVRLLIEQAVGRVCDLVPQSEAGGHAGPFHEQSVGPRGEDGRTTVSQYDLRIDGHAYRLCPLNAPSAMPLGMQVRHLPEQVMVVPSRRAGGTLD